MSSFLRARWPSLLLLVSSLALVGVLAYRFAISNDDPVEEASAVEVEPATRMPLADPFETYDPVEAGEPLPDGYRPLLRRDDIDPIYEPEFVRPDEVGWAPETLVVGLAVADEARAYPVNFMNVHEMVNDRIAGIPVLVSW